MKKGKIYFNPNDKLKYLILEDGKEIKLPRGYFKADIKASEKLEVNYDESKMKDGIPFIEQALPTKIQNQGQMNQNNREPARAPYNFVPLNETVISGQPQPNHDRFYSEDAKLNREDNKRYSGYVDVQIKTVTPFFIRQEKEQTDFFRVINGKPIIPGSTFRGLIRNMVEILSFSKIEFYDNKHFYKRFNIINDNPNDIKWGFIRRVGKNFKIFEITTKPTQVQHIENNLSKTPYNYKFNNDSVVYSVGKFQGICRVWKFQTNFKSGDGFEVPRDVIDGYNGDVNRDEKSIHILKSLEKGFIVDGTKDNIHIGPEKNQVPIQGIPVFFRAPDGDVISFGNSKFHRIPYEHKIGDFIVQNSSGTTEDFTKAIFGSTDYSTRVFFEDGLLQQINEPEQFEVSIPQLPKILSSPKPTSYQLYLEQKDLNVSETNQRTWKDRGETVIRGYKGYWHRKTSSNKLDKHSWIENGPQTNSHSKEIKPLKAGASFCSRLRFENLTAEELGALLCAIELPKDCCHKMGMGKPLGLGSVEIEISNFIIIDRQKRYGKLFDGSAWHIGLDTNKLSSDYFKNKFAKLVCSVLQMSFKESEGVMNLWNIERLSHFQKILSFSYDHNGHFTGIEKLDNFQWLNISRYMEIQFKPSKDSPYFRVEDDEKKPKNEYKNRPILPNPNEVVQKDIYKKP
ncbi:MAG: TIGR03986 family CRISPR-associated RAMP protein [Saprospiraceae bacterium]|nr:TIGR03986 family CRISPR-associated RAMP protein [Saprospiraceae bacterium]